MAATINPSTSVKAASVVSATAIDRIHVDLDKMVSRLTREIWLGGILAVGSATIASLLILLVIDTVFQPESAWLRITLWVPAIGAVGMATRYLLVLPLRRKCDRLAMAWALEQKQPAIEERLTTSLQLSEISNEKRSSIIEAVAQQAHGSLAGCQQEDLRGKDVFVKTLVAGVCLATFVLSMWIWAHYLVPSLQNVLNPWNPRVLPRLNATIIPGDARIAEGRDLQVTATASQLVDAVLEIIENDTVIASYPMAMQEAVGKADFTLKELTSDRQYRIRAGGLYSNLYQVSVDPKPLIKSSRLNLTFPKYMRLPSEVINDLAEPIEVLHGTRIQVEVDSSLSGVKSSLKLNGTTMPSEETVLIDETGLWRHSWEFTSTADQSQRGIITLVSEAEVPSEPLPFEVRTLPDVPPSIEIDQPALSEIVASCDQRIQIEYHAVDDFGFSKLYLTTQRNSEQPSIKELPHGLPTEFDGQSTVELNELDVSTGDQLTVWLSISDCRPEEYGGAQVVDSRKIRVQIADDSIPVGQQVVRNEEQALLKELADAVEDLRQASEFADAVQSSLIGEEEGLDASDEKDAASKQLRDRITEAEQTLRRISDQDELAPQRIFQPEIERIEEVTKNEIAEAKKQAGLVPLSDELPQQQEAMAATKEALNDAIEKLEQVQADVEERGKRLELAAQLDELAKQQERLVQEQREKQADAAGIQQKQQKVADDLQRVVEEDLDAKSEQFAQRAEEAAKLAVAAAQLQQQQENLATLDQVRSKEELDDKLLDMIAKEQEQIASETKMLEESRKNVETPAAGANEQAEHVADKGAEAEQKENPTALAETRKQMESVSEKLRQKKLEQAEVDAGRAGKRLQEEANSVPENTAMQPNPKVADKARQERDDLERLAKQQRRIRDAIEAVRESRPEEASEKLQEQIADRTERLRDKAEELLERPTEDLENQQAVREARERLEQARKETKAAEQTAKQQKQADEEQQADPQHQAGDPKAAAEGQQKQADQRQQQKQAAKSLEEASKSLQSVCKSCKKCSNCNKPGGSGSSSSKSGSSSSKQSDSKQSDSKQSDSKQGDSKQGDSKQGEGSGESGKPSSQQEQDSKRLAAAADKAHQAARNPSPNQTRELAEELNQLADGAAARAGQPNRNSKPQNGQPELSQLSDASQQGGSPESGDASKPEGVQGNAGAGQSEVAPTQLRGRSTSNWTQSRRKLENKVLDDQDTKVPEEFRRVVKDYFEELSRLESRQEKSEKKE